MEEEEVCPALFLTTKEKVEGDMLRNNVWERVVAEED